MNEKDYRDKMDEALRHAEDVKQRQELKKIKHSNDKGKKPLSFSKFFSMLVFVNLFIVELYSMVVMAVFHDLSHLGGLITSVVGQCITIISYMYKAKSENCEGGITYETAMLGLKNDNMLSYKESSLEESVVESQSKISDEDDGAVG